MNSGGFVPSEDTRNNVMVRTTIVFFGCLATAIFFLTSHHNGVAEQQNKDRTGAPGSQPICSACHSGGNFDVSSFVMMTDLQNTTEFNAYSPGETYLLHFILNEGSGGAAGFGFQSTLIDSNGNSAGTFSNPSANGQLENVNSRHIFEHNDLSAANTFTVQWTAPVAGTGDVTAYFAGIAANGNGGTGGDAVYSGSMSWPEGSSNIGEEDATPLEVIAFLGELAITGGEPNGNTRIEVYNTLGACVAQDLKSDFCLRISTVGWPSGAYIIRACETESTVPHSFRVFVH